MFINQNGIVALLNDAKIALETVPGYEPLAIYDQDELTRGITDTLGYLFGGCLRDSTLTGSSRPMDIFSFRNIEMEDGEVEVLYVRADLPFIYKSYIFEWMTTTADIVHGRDYMRVLAGQLDDWRGDKPMPIDFLKDKAVCIVPKEHIGRALEYAKKEFKVIDWNVEPSDLLCICDFAEVKKDTITLSLSGSMKYVLPIELEIRKEELTAAVNDGALIVLASKVMANLLAAK